MMLTKVTLPPFLSGRIFPKHQAGSEQRRNRHTDRQDSFSPLSDQGHRGGTPGLTARPGTRAPAGTSDSAGGTRSVALQ